MSKTTIKGFKINGEKYGLNLTQIGSYLDSGATEVEIVSYIDSRIAEEISNLPEPDNGASTTPETPNQDNSGTAAVGSLLSSDGSEFELKVGNDSELYAEKKLNIAKLVKPSSAKVTSLNTSYDKLYINSFYCGGLNADVHTLNYCTHNFVELSNLTNQDINLDGLSLQYLKAGGSWADILPLKGIIKAGSTFLIRGAQCSNIDGAKIKVEKYDMEWRNSQNELIKFSDKDSPSFFLCFGVDACATTNPGWQSKWDTAGVDSRFVDLVGVDLQSNTSTAYCKVAYPYKKETTTTALFKKYYAMDPVSQANKALSGRSNDSDWTFVDLTKDSNELIPSIEDNTPKARRDSKSMYYDKSKLLENKPSIITCSFGIQATDNGEGATRCFNWVSKGRHNEFIWIRKKGEQTWGIANESFKNETGVRKYYNRLNIEYGDGIVFTVHKFIKKGLEAGQYEYIAGRANRDKTPILDKCTDVRTFTVRTDAEVANGFKFIQTSDQQGFNWDEYRIWEGANYAIANEALSNDVHFMINTGDMTQNGSRMNEWLDYFNGKDEFMNSLEEMATVGNNDLSPKETYKIPDGKDNSKVSLENFRYFYTYEMDEENPPVFSVNSVEYFIPSLYSFNYGNTHFMCVVSEIKQAAEEEVYGFEGYGHFYPLIKEWCVKDLATNKDFTWNVAFCHEMPFTILTQAVTDTSKDAVNGIMPDETINDKSGRGGASVNINNPEGENYWFSEFCQNNNIRLVMGGHKHTQSTSWPMLENVKYDGENRTVYSFRPIIVLSDNPEEFQAELAYFSNMVSAEVPAEGATLVTLADGRVYPSTWVENGEIIAAAKTYAPLCEFIQKTADIKPVTYAMSQATSYKHTSNKELPSNKIPWLRYYYPNNNGKANAGQTFPFYTVWNVGDEDIQGHVRKVVGAFGGTAGSSSGKFDINKHGDYVLNHLCATDGEHNKPIYSINGLGNGIAADADTHIIITK